MIDVTPTVCKPSPLLGTNNDESAETSLTSSDMFLDNPSLTVHNRTNFTPNLANTGVMNSQYPFEDAEKSESPLSQENDSLGRCDEPGGISDTSDSSELSSPSEGFPPYSENEISGKSISTLNLTPTGDELGGSSNISELRRSFSE